MDVAVCFTENSPICLAGVMTEWNRPENNRKAEFHSVARCLHKLFVGVGV